MFNYTFTCGDDKEVTLTLDKKVRNYHQSVGYLHNINWLSVFDKLCARDHIKNYWVNVLIKDKPQQLMPHDLYHIRNLIDVDKPPIQVESELDWITLTGFAKLALLGKLGVGGKTEFGKESKKPTSKKEVFKDWSYA